MSEFDSATEIAALARQIEGAHMAAIGSARNAIEHAVRCGRLLIEAKSAVPPGEWTAWVSGNLSFGLRQAQKYARLAAHINSDAKANCEFASIDGALRALRRTYGPDAKPAKRSAAADAGRRRGQNRNEAIAQLTVQLEDVAARFGEGAVRDALQEYRSNDLLPVNAKLMAESRHTGLMALPVPTVIPPTEALELLRQGLGALEADGGFPGAVRELATVIAGVERELGDRQRGSHLVH